MLTAGAGREGGERGGRGRIGRAVVVAEAVRDAQDPAVREGGGRAALPASVPSVTGQL